MINSLPPWMPHLLAGLLAGVLVLTTVLLGTAIVQLPKLASANLVEVADRAPQTLDEVSNINENVDSVTPSILEMTQQFPLLTPRLDDLLKSADRLHDDVTELQTATGPLNESAARLVEVADQVNALQTSLTALEAQAKQINTLKRPIEQLATSAEPLPAQLERLNRSADALAGLARLVDLIDPLISSLQNMERHVANLDKKTGPVLLPDLTSRP